MANTVSKAGANHFDAIVVGSGMSGGWAAKELCEKGLATLVLERGRNIRHVADYSTALKDPWQLPHNNRPTSEDRKAQPVQSTLYLYDQSTKQHFVDDLRHPYVQEQPFNWFRGYQVGGRSLMWARHVFRYSDLDFEANLKEGVGVDWPIRYADISPWYDHVEKFIGASGENSGLPQLPAQNLQPPFEMNALEKHIRAHMAEAFKGERKLICSATAVLSREHNGRGPCRGRNQCARGCPFSAYFSSNGVTLPAAAATGNLTLRPDSLVHSLIYDDAKRRVTGVRVIDTATRQTTEYSANLVFLCASALNSTAILLNSTSARFPDGLGNDSGELGHNLMDHHNGGGATASYSGLLDRYYRGRRSTSMYIPRFRNVARKEPNFKRGYGYEVYTSRGTWTRGLDSADFGADFKNEITRPGEWQLYMEGYGETLAYHDNRMWLARDTDPLGMPKIHVSMSYRDNERAMAQQMMDDAVEMMTAAKLENVKGFNNPVTPGSVIHEMGTARMGRDPKTSVLNAHNQLHAVPNVFVTDGSCMVSSPTQNPSLTYMALTARAAHYAVEALKKKEI
ncbi:MAG TPA: GMC family oxidoreductase [Steroidobacteraceae bacterium]|nr:GMC family oxidoreductase [Steroidobacteraceae bacterium]